MALTYNQHEVLIALILSCVSRVGATAILDIGGGTVETAVPISKLVLHYSAVEQNATRAAALKTAGLDVIEARFPISLARKYSLVVASHSLPSRMEEVSVFLEGASVCVDRGGCLLVVTFADANPHIFDLRARLTGFKRTKSKEYSLLIDMLSRFGSVETWQVVSEATSHSLDEMLAFVEEWIFYPLPAPSDGRSRLASILDDEYLVAGGLYRFCTSHNVVLARRHL
jgi:hypothetical protein